jgi:hypothetical protein
MAKNTIFLWYGYRYPLSQVMRIPQHAAVHRSNGFDAVCPFQSAQLGR